MDGGWIEDGVWKFLFCRNCSSNDCSYQLFCTLQCWCCTCCRTKIEWMMILLLRRFMVDSAVTMSSASKAMLAANNSIICCCLTLTNVEILSHRLCFQWKWKHYSMLIQTKICQTDCWTVLLLEYQNSKCPTVYRSSCYTIAMQCNAMQWTKNIKESNTPWRNVLQKQQQQPRGSNHCLVGPRGTV